LIKACLNLFLLTETKNSAITIQTGVSLKKNQIREFDYLPENKPSGFEISENIFIRPRVSVSYLRGMVEDLNSIIGFYNNSVQNELDERLGKTDESSTEGGIELSWYF